MQRSAKRFVVRRRLSERHRQALHGVETWPSRHGTELRDDEIERPVAHGDRLGQEPAGIVEPGLSRGFIQGATRCFARRGLDLAHASRQRGQPSRVEAFRGERRHEAAQSCAGEARVEVAGVVHEGPTARAAGRDEANLGHIEQGAEMQDAIAVDHRRHAGQPGGTRAAHQAEQHGLGLIVARMGGREMRGADPLRAINQQGIAMMTSPLLQAGCGLSPVQVRM